NFADKQQLFSDVVVGVAARAEEFIAVMRKVLHETDDLKAALRVLGQRYLLTVVQPRGLQLRRLIIAEADRFPKLARAYYERAPERTLTELATLLQSLSEKGFLRIQDPEIAANHLAYLILGQILDKAMFLGNEYAPTTEELERHTDAAIGAFLAAYGA
ncbi:MAG TPA: TetR/AcrR family transcriptional regulator C-terminal domain-containing protein, partial [Dehalococcoidia bacterium]|nr:TetR/AcrR family transcriptional regulator C-terminal domain-containing protein [Dehalococcoidia bacterium]